MRALLTCVDYAGELALTLPYNAHHFSEILVVTTPEDEKTQAVVASVPNARCHPTRAFYPPGVRGPVFAKWAALEEALDAFGRHGWLTIMDADVLWPKSVRYFEAPENLTFAGGVTLRVGDLCTPLRRMVPLPGPGAEGQPPLPLDVENCWRGKDVFPLHPQQREWAGYSQTFHCDDPHLGPPPWHDVRWRHCGGADSFFQAKWPDGHKVRPPFDVLHIGRAGENWLGRSSPYADGTIPVGAEERKAALRDLIRRRSGSGPDRFRHERLGG